MARPSLPFKTDHPELMRRRRQLADLMYPGGLDAVPTEAPVVVVEAPAPEGALVQELAVRDVPVEPRLKLRGPLFQEFAALLSDEDEATLLELAPDVAAWLADADPLDRRAVLIAMAVSRDLLDLRERSGLSAALPPEDVHAMSHVEWSTGGDPWYADMIDTAFTDLGVPLTGGARVLDFGCSSGRVVRMLAARRPDTQMSGCDVNAGAIAWARSALPGIDFREQPLRPPLSYDDASFDAAYAISIWSHFDAAPARAWLDEMHRVLRPGGLLLITTHGPGAVAFRSAQPDHGEVAQRHAVVDLYRSGFSFVDSFGDDGDWGVVDREWGVSYMSPEWLLREITPKWSAALYRPAAIDYHQDLWVLRREG